EPQADGLHGLRPHFIWVHSDSNPDTYGCPTFCPSPRFGRPGKFDAWGVVGRDSDIWGVSGRYFAAQDPRYDGISPNDASNIRKLPNNHEGRGALDLGALIKARQINGHLNNGLPNYLNNGLLG
ncbi:hypothetical protein, partial [Enorma massiliensis]|uniref:hypothetical protein n=1 Tax=Enorma massiliensis TaxID=1472761 RepID=UPI0019598BBC